MKTLIIGTLATRCSALTSDRTASRASMRMEWAIRQKRTRLNHSCVRMVSYLFYTLYFVLFCLFLLVGHTHIDILKIDLEGWEFDALTAFLVPGSEFSSERPRIPPVSQMLLELHVWNREFPELLRWWNTLERAGFRAVVREPNLVYQNYNRMQGAELAEVRRCNFSSSPQYVVNRRDSTRFRTLRSQTFLYQMLF